MRRRFLLTLCASLIATPVLTGCTLSLLNSVTSSHTYIKSPDIAYGDDMRQRLDVYRPHQQKISQAPVVVFFYGGSWINGRREDYKFIGEALASRGIVTVVADYRVYPQVRYPEFVDDAARAVAWTLQHIDAYGGDRQRVFVMGHSAGAYNAAMVALDARWLKPYGFSPQDLRGWIGLAGPYDFIPVRNEDVKPIFFYPDTPVESQPINHVSAAAPPALLAVAEHDDLVDPQRNTIRLAQKLRDARVSVRLHVYPDISHGNLIAAFGWPLRGFAPVLRDVEDFVLRQ